MKAVKFRSKAEQDEIVKRALSMSSEARKTESPMPEFSPIEAHACWNCGATMSPAKDIYSKAWWACNGCAVSSSELPRQPQPFGLPRAWVFEEVRDKNGELRAVKIASEPLDDFLWLILDRSFTPNDGLAYYYPEEIPLLKTKTPEELEEIHKVKLAFPGCRVIQEGPEAKASQ